MKPFNKEEYNKLCAEFMGYINTTLTDKDFNIHEHPLTKKMIETNYCNYFTDDWNWIMEVVDKINDPDNGIMVSIHPNSCMITDNGRRGKWSINAISNIVRIIDAKDRKEAVVQAIWEFLQFYNQQKQD